MHKYYQGQRMKKKVNAIFYTYLLSCKNALSLSISCRSSSVGSTELTSSLSILASIFAMFGFRETGTKHEQSN